ncbi:globoside alpha-1,3-N-acetylgalactosaminyltransferase 1-like isoform X2 [Tachysurus fulvidraco]|uniref:globoside alpha-1,3-N-acetylgalactosaminyltransferase 1-like isoform X2 n=1 Tax=Tachysurus fulvidraco TaxID=1234273 RepID=UPI001FEE5EEA|nr:globoside alpha-1,3-N-acetylgalactosaminyltransferase 1-like isoform X2 [Tachysurus fulvidraco]
MRQNLYLLFAILAIALLGFFYLGYTFSWLRDVNDVLEFTPSVENKQDDNMELLFPKGIKYKQPGVSNSRSDVTTVTPWLAPIVWEGTFDLSVIDAIYLQKNITVATTVFALGKYVRFLKDFLESAEQHFMVGYQVHYYLFTDRPDEVPMITLRSGRQLTKIKTLSSDRWQEITLRRMEMIEKLIEERLVIEADYIFSLDVDTKFYGHWGAETLADIVAVLHPGYFGTPRTAFPYERRPESVAFIPPEEGDYYYGGAVIGGRIGNVLKLTKTCRTQLDVDQANKIEAAWQEESHLNKYFLYNKPSKVLSPEYLWQDFKEKTSNMKVIRFSQVIKNYAEVRPNP